MEFDILPKYIIFYNFFYPKSSILCPEMVLTLDYMVYVAICIIIPGNYRIHGNKCPFSL